MPPPAAPPYSASSPSYTMNAATVTSTTARLAREQNVPAYVIFHDATLAAIAQARPENLAALGEIPGMGRTKLERYGETVLAAVRGQG